MPSLLSISRGAAASSSILRRHHHFRKHILLFDASSSSSRHQHRCCYSQPSSPAGNHRNDGCRLFSSSSLDQRYYSRRRDTSNSIEKSAWNITSRSAAAAMRNDSSLSLSSSSKRVEESSSSSSKYNESNKQSTVDTDTTKTSNIQQQQQQPRGADWRAWFSSSEYDDPWSPYRPLRRPTTTTQQQEQPPPSNTNTNTTLANISNTNSANTVDNILTNYNHWERRRHGMNLVPLSLHYNNNNSPHNHLYSTPVDNENDDNNDILHRTEQGIKLQKRTQWIDTQTRFTIQLLNDLYYTGIRRQMDRPTTERCHRMIGRLLSLTPREGNVVLHLGADSGDNNDNNSGGAENNDLLTVVVVQITGAAQRGNAILERMEWCSPAFLPQLRKWQRQQQQQQQGVMDELDMSNVVSTTATDYPPTKSVPKHLIQTKQVIPTPTLAIYNMVLLLYGKEAGSKYVAEQAEDVVWSMIVRGLQLEEFNESHSMIGPNNTTKKKKGAPKKEEKGGGEDITDTTTTTSAEPIYPRTQHWNCVLQCWSNSTDSNRAILAYSFFKSWMEWNAKCVGRGMGVEDARCDLESFHWILKSCVVDESTTFDDEGDTTTGKKLITKRAKEIGSRVAMGLWRDMRVWKDHYNTDESSTLTSDTYYQLLRALCQTSDLSRGWVATVAAVFQSCRSDGMETKEITDMVRGALTESQFQKLLLRSEVTSAASAKK